MNTRDHQNTQDTFTQAATHLQQAASSPEQIYQRAKDQVLDAADAVLNARKIVLSQAGIVRVLIESPGGKIRTGDNTPEMSPAPLSTQEYSTSTHEDDAQRISDALSGLTDDPIADAIFVCGDYYAPLSLNFSVSAQKITDESQLVDGINIVQRVAKGPKVVSVSFNIQRREAQEVEDMSATTIRRRNARGGDPTPVYKLTRFLDELYENDEVFAIENTVLNDEIGIGWAFIKSYRFSPMQGDTFGSINLVLQEVNIADPLLYTNSANTQDSQSVPTTVK
ncbi:hypothetical protein [uncultured Dialister sp.]|jgi:hypothetical protein|uniref:hypothetical protein n=1 Tax=uncultured Dialister sp. TaxID=278064 RepID=UPI0026DEB206|nr:hypothetical protein [uncultured Dialister sp.]